MIKLSTRKRWGFGGPMVLKRAKTSLTAIATSLLRGLSNFHFFTRQAMSPSLTSPFRIWHQDVAKMLNVQLGLLPPLKATMRQKTIRFPFVLKMNEWKASKSFHPSRNIPMEEVTGTLFRERESPYGTRQCYTMPRILESGSASIEEKVEVVIREESEEVSSVKVISALKDANTSRRRFNDKQKKRSISPSSFFLMRRQGEKQMPVKYQKRWGKREMRIDPYFSSLMNT